MMDSATVTLSWMLASNRISAIGVGSAAVLALCAATPAPAVANSEGWTLQPWIGLGTGAENERIVDPEFSRLSIPGGVFAQVTPGFIASRRLSDATNLRVLNRTAVEQFLARGGRRLFAGSLAADVRIAVAARTRVRTAILGHYFNDTTDSGFRRIGGGGEAAVGHTVGTVDIELAGFLSGRKYPNVLVDRDSGPETAYAENHRGAGGNLSWAPRRSILFRGSLSRRWTDSRDPRYDSKGSSFAGDLEIRPAHGLSLQITVAAQSRTFVHRATGEDHDSYLQYGFGISRDLKPGMTLLARLALADYSDPAGGNQTTRRGSVGIRWGFGSDGQRDAGAETGTRTPIPPAVERSASGETLFRIKAPLASYVAVAGTFNAWSPSASPLLPGADGWWTLRLRLAPGRHHYVFLVDGHPVVPHEVGETVDDGFGGTNAIIEVIGLSP